MRSRTPRGFGLVHGFGLSTRLQDLGIPEDDLLWRVLAFNLGVEIGQLAAIGAIFAVGLLIARLAPDPERLVGPAFAGLVGAGLIAAAVLSSPSDAVRERPEVVAEASGCVVESSSPPEATAGGGHPDRAFYRPGDNVPVDDLNHVVGDGYLVVRYANDLPAGRRAELSRWLESAGPLVVGAPAPDIDGALVAQHARRTMTCDALDTSALTEFKDSWFAELS